MRWIVAILLACGNCVAGSFSTEDRVAGMLLRTEVSSDGLVSSSGPMNVIVDSTRAPKALSLDADLIYGAVRNSLRSIGFASKRSSSDLREQIKQGSLVGRDAVAAKLIVEVAAVSDGIRTFQVECSISLVDFQKTHGSWRPRLLWSKSQETDGVGSKQADEVIVEFVQKEIPALKSVRTQLNAKPPTSPAIASGQQLHSQANVANAAYSLRWIDPDGKRNKFYFGVSLGTPAIVNLNLGYWGGREFPVLFEVSGLYIDETRRGIQTQVAWIFDNEGVLRQAGGLFFAGLPESISSSQDSLDALGRVTRTTTTTTLLLTPYLGPSYLVEWRNLRVQTGLGAALVGNSQTFLRGMFQFAYTLPVGL